MKRIIKPLIIFILLVPLFVLADGGGPILAPYDAYVSDPNGASIYTANYEDGEYSFKKTDQVLKYKKEIKVIDEYKASKDASFGRIIKDGEQYSETEYWINLDKISTFKEEYTVSDLKKELKYLEENGYGEGEANKFIFDKSTMIVLSNEVPMYKGPSTKYAKKDTILKKEDVVDFYDSLTTWIYVEKGNINGWIKREDCIYFEKTGPIWLLEDAKTFEMKGAEEFRETSYKIPKGEKFDEVFYTWIQEYDEKEDDSNIYYYYRVKYNDNIYYISDKNKIAIAPFGDYSSNFLTVSQINIYNDYNGKKVGTISKNKKIKAEYYIQYYNEKEGGWINWFYIKYDNNNYWIKDHIAQEYSENRITVRKSNCYESINGTVELTIPANTTFSDYYLVSGWYNIQVNNKYYWIRSEDVGGEYSDAVSKCEELEEDVYLYEEVDNNPTDNIVPKGTKICPKYSYYNSKGARTGEWYYIKDKKYEGWISLNDGDLEESQSSIVKEYTNEEENIRDAISKQDSNEINENDEPDEVVSDNKLSNKEMIIICVLSAIILSLVVFVTIKLLNKKKKENQTTESVNESNAEKTSETTQVVEINKDDKTIEESQQETTMGEKNEKDN